jgi:hypothetical protein
MDRHDLSTLALNSNLSFYVSIFLGYCIQKLLPHNPKMQ